MAFSPYSGNWETKSFRSKASVDYDIGDVLGTDDTDIVLGTSSLNTDGLLGICKTDKPSTDATNGAVLVQVPKDKFATARASVESGTLTAAYEGRHCDLNSEDGIDIDTNTKSHFKIVKFLSATEAVVSFNF